MSEIDNIELWELKKFVEKLEAAHGNGTSMISLMLTPGEKIALATRKLTEEEGTAVNIKSRVNRLSVITAIRTCLGRLKMYSQVPKNGLCIFSGTVMTDEGKERKVLLDYEPPLPLTSGMYLCDSRFHTEPLRALLVDNSSYGFIIMDGQCSIFGVLSGSNKQILQRITVDLPKKHNKGGQSSVRFGRLRTEKRHNYVRKVCELAVKNFIGKNTNMTSKDSDPGMEATSTPNVKGLIVGGAAGFKNELVGSDMFDQRLKRIVLKTIDLPYGDEEGFNCAIKQSEDVLKNVRYVEEAKLIRVFLEEVGKNNNKYCFGMDDLMKCLEMGAVETILLNGESKVIRLKVKKIESKDGAAGRASEEEEEEEEEDGEIDLECLDDDQMLDALDALETGKVTKKHKKKEEDKDKEAGTDSAEDKPIVQFIPPPPEDPENKFMLTARKLEGGDDVYHVIRSEYVTDYFVRKYHKAAKAGNSRCWGAELQFVSDNSSEGAQFVHGFGGIGGILRYPIDVAALKMLDEEDGYAGDSDLQDLSDFI